MNFLLLNARAPKFKQEWTARSLSPPSHRATSTRIWIESGFHRARSHTDPLQVAHIAVRLCVVLIRLVGMNKDKVRVHVKEKNAVDGRRISITLYVVADATMTHNPALRPLLRRRRPGHKAPSAYLLLA